MQIIDSPNEPLVVEIRGKAYECKQWKDIAYKRAPILDVKELEKSWKVTGKEKPKSRHPWR